jgi:hypothetical protein
VPELGSNDSPSHAIAFCSRRSCEQLLARDEYREVWNAFRSSAQTYPRKSRSGWVAFVSLQDNGDKSNSVHSDNGYATVRGATMRLNSKSTSGHAKRRLMSLHRAQLPRRRKLPPSCACAH